MVDFWLWILWRYISAMRPEWIIALATIVYASLTLWIILEMRRDRKLAHKPILDATLSKAAYPDLLLFEIKNVGRGPALRCVFICRDSGMLEWKTEVSLLPIGAGEAVELKFESGRPEKWTPGDRMFLDIEYSDIFRKAGRQRIFEAKTNAVLANFPAA